MILPMLVAYNGKLVVVGPRKGNELNTLVKPNSYKPLIILSESRYTHERAELGQKVKCIPLSTVPLAAQTRRLEGLPVSFSHPPVSPIKKMRSCSSILPSWTFCIPNSFSGMQSESIVVFGVSPFPGI